MTNLFKALAKLPGKFTKSLSSLRYLTSTRERTLELQQQLANFSERTETNIRVSMTNIRESMTNIRESIEASENKLLDKIASCDQRFTVQLADLRREILFQQRRLTRLTTADAAVAATPHVGSSPTNIDRRSERLDCLYVAFEDVFRGSREYIKNRFAPYVERITAVGSGQPEAPILDIGCGRGEWLELLKEKHLAAYGIDTNSMMVEYSRSQGFDARCVDLLEHLNSLKDASISAITAFHVVEHIPFDVLVDTLDEALRVLVSGGILILETPNPETIRVGATTFYNDPTHRNPIPPEPLKFIVGHRGFSDVEILRLHPYDAAEHFEGNDPDTQRLNQMLFGPQDYAIIARRG